MTENTLKHNNNRLKLTFSKHLWFFIISFISHVENEILKIIKAQKGESQSLKLLRENEEVRHVIITQLWTSGSGLILVCFQDEDLGSFLSTLLKKGLPAGLC